MHGYEIKSSKDNLLRLQNQLLQYSKSLQKVTFVVAENHYKDVRNSTPEWCRRILATKGPRGGLSFSSILCKSEAILLYQHGIIERLEPKNRKELYKQLNQIVIDRQLALEIKAKLLKRGN